MSLLARRVMSGGDPGSPGAGGGWVAEVEADSPVSFLRLGESSGTTAADETGNGNTGTYVGSPTLSATGLVGDADSAVNLDGSNDYINWNTIAGDIASSDFTLECWVDPDSNDVGGDGDAIFAINTSAGGNRLLLRYGGDASEFKLDDGAGSTRTAIVDGAKHHVVLVRDSGTLKLYVDSYLVIEWTKSITVASDDQISIGQEFDSGSASDFFDGVVDEAVAYTSVLSAARIQAHYEAVLARAFNPFGAAHVALTVHDAVWAGDPQWSNPGDGNAVPSWRNPFDVDPAQATGANQPTFRASTTAYNNKPTVQFDGSDVLYANVGNPGGAYTIVVVGNTAGANSTKEVLASALNASGEGVGDNASDEWMIDEGTEVSGGTSDSDPHVFVAVFNGASSTLHVDGTQVASGNPGSTGVFHMVVGAATSGGATPITGHVAFVGFYDASSRDSDIQALETALADHYGITLA